MVKALWVPPPLTTMWLPASMSRLLTISGRSAPRLIVPDAENVIELVPVADPAGHSPAAAPEAVCVFAAMIASRRVQAPSLAATSVRELTDIEAAIACETASEPRRGKARRRAPSRRIMGGHTGRLLWGGLGDPMSSAARRSYGASSRPVKFRAMTVATDARVEEIVGACPVSRRRADSYRASLRLAMARRPWLRAFRYGGYRAGRGSSPPPRTRR